MHPACRVGIGDSDTAANVTPGSVLSCPCTLRSFYRVIWVNLYKHNKIKSAPPSRYSTSKPPGFARLITAHTYCTRVSFNLVYFTSSPSKIAPDVDIPRSELRHLNGGLEGLPKIRLRTIHADKPLLLHAWI